MTNCPNTPWQLGLCLALALWQPFAYAEEKVTIQTDPIPKRGNAEFFSTEPTAKVLVAVNIWGEVHQPGIHYIPVGSPIMRALGSAGGPTSYADLSEVRILRAHSESGLNLFAESKDFLVQADDMIFVDRSLKADMPIIFGAVSTIVSVMTLYFVTRRQN